MASSHEIILPVAFSEPVQLILFTRYGDPRTLGWKQQWLHNWYVHEKFPWFPVRDLYVHKDFQILLENAFRELTVFDLEDEIKTVDKCYYNNCDEKGVLSAHSWGTAIDLNAKENPHGSRGKWSEQFIDIMMENNIWCGQNAKYPKRFSMIEA